MDSRGKQLLDGRLSASNLASVFRWKSSERMRIRDAMGKHALESYRLLVRIESDENEPLFKLGKNARRFGRHTNSVNESVGCTQCILQRSTLFLVIFNALIPMRHFAGLIDGRWNTEHGWQNRGFPRSSRPMMEAFPQPPKEAPSSWPHLAPSPREQVRR